jgi:hypothetical protein
MPSTSFINEADLPIAEKDAVVEIDVAGAAVHRKIFAGSRVPPDLVDAWRDQTGAKLTAREKEQLDALKDEDKRIAAVAKSIAETPPGETPDAEQGDPAPARQTRTRR